MTSREVCAGIATDLEREVSNVEELLREAEQADWQRMPGDSSGNVARAERKITWVQEALAFVLSALADRLMVYCEHLQLPSTRARVVEWAERWADDRRGETREFHNDENDGRDSPAFDELEPSIKAVLTIVRPGIIRRDTADKRQRKSLEHALRSLAKVCYERGVTPTKEADIRRVMHSHLEAMFPDYSRTATVTKPLMSFHADGGVPSLRALIECKFVPSATSVSTAVHGLTEDLSGYGGSREWRHFYSVVYLTAPFATEGQFSRALGASGNAGNWTTILVTGPGKGPSRRRKDRHPGRTRSRPS